MSLSPKSLTATIHVKFHYKEPESKSIGEGKVEIMSSILDQASELTPELQEILVQFADYLAKLGQKGDGRSSA